MATRRTMHMQPTLFPRHWAALAALLLPAALVLAAPTDEDELALVFGDQSLIQLATGGALPLRRAPAVATGAPDCRHGRHRP